jgi:hypothetical protein
MAKLRLQMPPCPHDRNTRTRYATAKLTISARDTVSVCMTAKRPAHGERSSLDRSMVNPGGLKLRRLPACGPASPPRAHFFLAYENFGRNR